MIIILSVVFDSMTICNLELLHGQCIITHKQSHAHMQYTDDDQAFQLSCCHVEKAFFMVATHSMVYMYMYLE